MLLLLTVLYFNNDKLPYRECILKIQSCEGGTEYNQQETQRYQRGRVCLMWGGGWQDVRKEVTCRSWGPCAWGGSEKLSGPDSAGLPEGQLSMLRNKLSEAGP